MNPYDVISKNRNLTQQEIDELMESLNTPDRNDKRFIATSTQKHQWIDSGVPGGSCWCKHCDVDFGKENGEYCEIKQSDFHLDESFGSIDFTDFEEEII